MKNRYSIPLLLLIPALMLASSLYLKSIQGPYYTNSQNDPTYHYLVSSLNLALFSSMGHVDHPGTPQQLTGAVIIRICYELRHSSLSIAEDVLLNSEKYLDCIYLYFIVLNCIGVFILGMISFKVYRNTAVSFLLQLTPVTSFSIFYMLNFNRPENLIMFVSCIFISLLICFINETELTPKKNFTYIISFGILTGFGIACKIIFFPLAIIPLILLKGIKSKLIFIAMTLISFIIFVIPALSPDNINYFLEWVFNLFRYNQKYGRGEPTIIDPGTFLNHIKRILSKEWIFDIAYILTSLAVLSGMFRNKSDNSGDIIKLKLLTGLFITMTLQILIVAKHYGENYMFPVLTLSAFAIFISISVLIKKETLKKNLIYLSILVISVNGIVYYYNYSRNLKFLTEESNKFLSYQEKYIGHQMIIVAARQVPNIETSLFGAVAYAKSQMNYYHQILNEKYPNTFFFIKGKCYSFSEDPERPEKVIKETDKIILMCPDKNCTEEFLKLFLTGSGISYKSIDLIFENQDHESIYEIKLK